MHPVHVFPARGAAALVLLAASAAVFATSNPSAGPQWPAGAKEKNDPRVLAFYDGMCAKYADQQGLAGTDREGFIVRCRTSIPNVFPVGYDESGGDGGGE